MESVFFFFLFLAVNPFSSVSRVRLTTLEEGITIINVANIPISVYIDTVQK